MRPGELEAELRALATAAKAAGQGAAPAVGVTGRPVEAVAADLEAARAHLRAQRRAASGWW